ncbi:hypothetical protein [Streptomyces sp. NBC_00207]|uniref:hypothetical protein n=1 Tax=unclassified Streptomyces TaxID=2593676 RepID=UPI0028854C0E|nr:hypothetical protein [Streptomyces sp. DSM 41633]
MTAPTKPVPAVPGCPVCIHSRRLAIEEALTSGLMGVTATAAAYRVRPADLRAHIRERPDELAAPGEDDLADLDTPAHSRSLVAVAVAEALETLDACPATARTTSARTRAVEALTRAAELHARTTGALTPPPPAETVVQIVGTPAWRGIVAILDELFAADPEARLAYAERLQELAEGALAQPPPPPPHTRALPPVIRAAEGGR